MKSDPVYHGNVQIYLEGQCALQVIDAECQSRHFYYLGSPESKILIKDFRREPVNAAKLTLSGQNQFEFADVFNQPAEAKVYRTTEGIEIELQEGQPMKNMPILWIGLVHNHEIPARKIHWKIIKQINEVDVAFAILTPQSNTI